MEKDDIKEIEDALKVIVKHCPCYGIRESDPISICIQNGLVLRNSDGRFITSGWDDVAKLLYKIGKKHIDWKPLHEII